MCLHVVPWSQGSCMYSDGPRAGILFPTGERFIFSTESRPVLKPSLHPTNGYRVVFLLGVKRPGCEAQQSPLSSAGVKNGEDMLPLIFIERCLINYTGSTSPLPLCSKNHKCILIHVNNIYLILSWGIGLSGMFPFRINCEITNHMDGSYDSLDG
jgi:hypothetical protein